MRFTGWKCKFSGKIFPTDKRDDYIKHLKVVRDNLRLTRLDMREQAEFEDWFSSEKAKITSTDEIAPWIMNNQERLLRHYKRNDSFVKKNAVMQKLAELNIRFNHDPFLSNSHSCPRGGVTNWGREGDRPTSYPGWRLRIDFKVDESVGKAVSFGASEFFSMIDIHTGSGGGGRHRSYDGELFEADWPVLAEYHQKDLVVNKLKTAPNAREYR